jgi:hypothetical protein
MHVKYWKILAYLEKSGKKLKLGKIIQIHTFHPDKYAGLFGREMEQVSNGEVLWCDKKLPLVTQEVQVYPFGYVLP